MFGFLREESDQSNPRVVRRSDRRGNTWWEIQNPMTGRITRVETDDAARICIEQKNY